MYQFTIQVSTGEFLRELTVDVEVEEVYGISKVLLCGASAIYPGNETVYCLEVTSLSNLPTDFSFRVEGAPTDWTIQVEPVSTVIDPYHARDFTAAIMPPKTTPNGFYQLQLILEYGPGAISHENITIYVLAEVEPDVPDDDTSWLSTYLYYLIGAVVLLIIIILVAALLVRSRQGGPKELPFEEGAVKRRRPLPPPPPPDAPPRRERPLPPPPPPRTPDTVEELLADTPVMERVSSEYDRYSADSQYATGETLAVQADPYYVGDCPSCGGKVMEHATGMLMCADCGAQYTEE
jgi:hypothetical protein